MNIFDDVKLGLEQAIEYEQGKTEATEIGRASCRERV